MHEIAIHSLYGIEPLQCRDPSLYGIEATFKKMGVSFGTYIVLAELTVGLEIIFGPAGGLVVRFGVVGFV